MFIRLSHCLFLPTLHAAVSYRPASTIRTRSSAAGSAQYVAAEVPFLSFFDTVQLHRVAYRGRDLEISENEFLEVRWLSFYSLRRSNGLEPHKQDNLLVEDCAQGFLSNQGCVDALREDTDDNVRNSAH